MNPTNTTPNEVTGEPSERAAWTNRRFGLLALYVVTFLAFAWTVAQSCIATSQYYQLRIVLGHGLEEALSHLPTIILITHTILFSYQLVVLGIFKIKGTARHLLLFGSTIAAIACLQGSIHIGRVLSENLAEHDIRILVDGAPVVSSDILRSLGSDSQNCLAISRGILRILPSADARRTRIIQRLRSLGYQVDESIKGSLSKISTR